MAASADLRVVVEPAHAFAPVPAPLAFAAGGPFHSYKEVFNFRTSISIGHGLDVSVHLNAGNNEQGGQKVLIIPEELQFLIGEIKDELCLKGVPDKLVLPLYLKRLVRLIPYLYEFLPPFFQAFVEEPLIRRRKA